MRASGRAAESIDCSLPSTLSSHQRAASGNDSSRSVSPVGAQSTTITSHSPDSTWPLSTSSEKSSSPPGGTVSSSAAIRSTPRSISSAAEPLRDRAPVVLELVLGLDLLGVQAARRRRSARRRPAPAARRPANAPGRWRSRACARPRPRHGAPWRPRRRSSRHRPCPCRGSSAAALRTLAVYGALLDAAHLTCRPLRGVPGEVGGGDASPRRSPGLLRRRPGQRLGAAVRGRPG